MMKLLGDAVKELEVKQLISYSYLSIAGYYDLDCGSGKFLMVDVIGTFDGNNETLTGQISWVIGSETKPTVYQLQQSLLTSGTGNGEYVLRVNDPNPVDLTFQHLSGEQRIGVTGSIDGLQVSGYSYINAIPAHVFAGTYTTEDGSDAVTIFFSLTSGSISFSDGLRTEEFNYDPVKRRFFWTAIDSNANYINYRLYMNVDAGHGLVVRFVQFDPNNPKATGSTKVFYANTNLTSTPAGPTNGAVDLATFAGYYPFNESSFVSIVGNTGSESVYVGVCLDGKNTTLYSSFTFQNNTLTFPFPEAPSMNFYMFPTYTSVNINLSARSSVTCFNYFAAAPYQAFGYRTLATNSNSTNKATLSFTVEGQLIYTMNGTEIFNTTEFNYESVLQEVTYDGFRLNFCYNPKKGVTCGVTKEGGGFNAVLYAYPL